MLRLTLKHSDMIIIHLQKDLHWLYAASANQVNSKSLRKPPKQLNPHNFKLTSQGVEFSEMIFVHHFLCPAGQPLTHFQ